MDARHVLDGYDASSLVRIAEGRGLSVPEYLPPSLLQSALAPLLLEQGSLLAAMSRLSAEELGALRVLVSRRPRDAEDAVALLQGRSREGAATVLLRLMGRGLVLLRPAPNGRPVRIEAPGNATLLFPEEVERLLEKGTTGPGVRVPPVRCAEADEADDAAQGPSLRLIRELLSVVRAARTEPIAIGPGTELAARSTARLLQAVSAGQDGASPGSHASPYRLRLLAGLLRGLSALVPDDAGKTLQFRAPAMEGFLALPRPEQVRALYRAWRDSTEPPSLLDLPGIARRHGSGAREIPDGTTLRRARQAVAEALRFLSREGWTLEGDFLGFLLGRHPDLLFPPPVPWNEPYYPGIEADAGGDFRLIPRHGGRERVEGAWVRRLLLDLADLGVLGTLFPEGTEPAEAPPGGLLFRPTSDGLYAAASGRRPDAGQGASGKSLVVQPTFEVIAFPDRVTPLDLYMVERFAEVGPALPAPTYRITVDSVHAAVCDGLDVAAISSFLEERSVNPLPQNVAFSLRDWAEGFERVVILPAATVIEFDDEDEAATVLFGSDLRQHGGFWAGPTVAVLPTTDRRGLARILGQNFPCDLDYAGGLPPCLRIAGDLTVEVDGRLLHFHARALLQRLAVPIGNGRWRIPPERLRQLGGTTSAPDLGPASPPSPGRASPSLVALRNDLLEMTAGEFPPELDLALDAASGQPATFGLQRVTLLTTESPAQMDRLAASPSSSSWLVARVGPTAAVVQEDLSADLRNRLAAVGVRVLDGRVGEPWAGGAGGDPGTSPGRSAGRPFPPLPDDRMPQKTVVRILREAIQAGREVVIGYDPGSRRPLQRLRTTPLSIEEGLGATYLVGSLGGGGGTTRRFSVAFIRSVEVV